MKTSHRLIVAAAIVASSCSTHADYLWNGAGDGVSIYQEANWLDTVTSLVPANDTINPNVEVNTALIATGGTPGGPGGGNAHLRLGTGSLALSGDTVFRMSSGASAGIRADAVDQGSNYAPVWLSDNAQLLSQFFSKLTVSLDDSAQITLYGGGNPLNNASIDFLSTAATVFMLNETPTTFLSEHLQKITFNGAAAILGTDPGMLEDGDNFLILADGGMGSVLTAVPEPSTYALMGLGLGTLAYYLWRRRDGI